MTLAGMLAITACGIALAHALPLRAASPLVAVTIWGSSLVLRALGVLLAAAYTIVYVPRSDLFAAVTHWCWHSILPLIRAHLGLDGHRVGDVAVVAPSLLVLLSVGSVAYGILRAARTLRRYLRRHALGPGPAESVIVCGGDVVLGAAGLTRPRVIVSAGALTAFDDDELAAGLAHERGHIAHRHRYVLLLAELCRGVARFTPGTRRAVDELRFHLERDADQWAIARRHDPFALASAICKAAIAGPAPIPGTASLVGAGVADRIRQLLDPHRGSRARGRLLGVAAAGLVAITAATAALAPGAAVAASQSLPDPGQFRHCDV